MYFLRCERPFWRGDDFTVCIRRDLFQVFLPLLGTAISALWLLISAVHRCAKSRSMRMNKYQLIPTHQNALGGAVDEETEDDDDDEFAEHLSLRHTLSRTTDHEIKIDRPRGELVFVVCEELSILGVLGIYIAAMITGTEGHSKLEGMPWIAGVITWSYILVLGSLRLGFSASDTYDWPLWGHTVLLYMLNFFFSTVAFRTALISPISKTSQALVVTEFALVTFLCLIAITSRRGNKPVAQEITEGLAPSKEPLASIFSAASFSWVDGIIWKGYWKPLVLEDVWNLRNDDIAVSVLAAFRQTKKTTSLAMTLVKHFKRDLAIQAAWAVFYSLFTFAPTLLLRVILEYISAPENTPKNVAWLFVVLLFVTAIFSAVGNGQALFIGRRICIRLRAVIIGEVYAKALRRKAAAGGDKILGEKKQKKAANKKKKNHSTENKKENEGEDGDGDGEQANVGAIINLMAVDSFKVAEVCAYLHFLFAGVPVQVIIAITLLYQILGWSSIAGIGVMVLLLPINYLISRQFSIIQQEIMATTDKRIHTTNEVLQNIRIIKYFAWEERFDQVVNESRSAELKQLRNRYVLWAIAATSWYSSPMLITFLSFLCYTVIEGKDLNAPIAFTSLSLFNVLRVPLDQLADMITNVLQTKVSVDRVEEFLAEEETEKYHQLRHREENDLDAPLIGFKGATFTWGSRTQAKSKVSRPAFQLQNLDIEFVPGKLNIIAGPTGSGKTSLLMALLGEMTHIKGNVYLPGSHSREDLIPDPVTGLTDSVAYCAQQAWLVNDTIKANILFASPYNEERYRAVLIACSLERDLEILDNGDETEVGEKGVTLSGGQKQRISLARALYSNSAHLLLDDCLSAVDSHTSKWIYDYCIMGPLMQSRTCILVTHNVALCVPQSKYVVVLENGRILIQGSPEVVIASGALGSDEALRSGARSKTVSRMPSRVPSFIGEPRNGQDEQVKDRDPKVSSGSTKQKDKKSNDETKSEGGVDWKVYRLYLSSMGPWWYWVIVLAIFGTQQLGSVATSVWIRQWALEYGNVEKATYYVTGGKGTPSFSFDYSGSCFASGSCSWGLPTYISNAPVKVVENGKKVDVWYYLIGYAIIGLTYSCTSFIREAVVFSGSLRASRKIHQQLMHHIMRAKFKFFDSTPLGRIMNRFSKDMEAIDQEVAPVALAMVHCLASVVAIVILISVITPGFLGAGVLITLLYWLIGVFYLRASRDLQRLESIQRSPLYQHFGETITGVSTIRAYGDERRFVRDNLHKIDSHNRPFFYLWACNRWLGFRVDVAGALVSFFAGAFVVSNVGKIDAGLAGLSLTYAITFTDNILWVVRLYATNEQNMNSVERVREYLEVEQEAPGIIPENRPDVSWPDKGAVSFNDYSTRYRPDLDLVLKHVSFTIKPLEKVGIVGRTGAGKSSLALALFRGLEAETGKIVIDGVDISSIGLQDLRQSITMVPQDPTLFTGTIRSNLDPFGIYTDEDIFTALKRVQLINEVPDTAAPVAGDDASVNKNIFLDLQSVVSESGNNLSQGQKQLLCLARALLKTPKVLLMDEATASIDYSTDTKIQATIRELKSTTITIAHRLNSIIYYDKVLVLEQGEVKEFDHPHNLLKNKDSIFREMCESSGELELLVEMARKAYEDQALVETAAEE